MKKTLPSSLYAFLIERFRLGVCDSVEVSVVTGGTAVGQVLLRPGMMSELQKANEKQE
ncbi:hypothetical protein [Rufibacter psychrotolerans]|uniref:hypothetical protein n=1 Tax=Rufibacter psychrotolerans TaxID=2812556 RepID=UPI00196833C8|nr:hypothetical protein [Rufibacter sp. SYSU D00308]